MTSFSAGESERVICVVFAPHADCHDGRWFCLGHRQQWARTARHSDGVIAGMGGRFVGRRGLRLIFAAPGYCYGRGKRSAAGVVIFVVSARLSGAAHRWRHAGGALAVVVPASVLRRRLCLYFIFASQRG